MKVLPPSLRTLLSERSQTFCVDFFFFNVTKLKFFKTRYIAILQT